MIESHPVRVRGLKQSVAIVFKTPYLVAPRAGAWIETLLHVLIGSLSLSHPVRVRGLKQ